MCDFSLHLVKSRPAQVADKLVTTIFNNSTTRGFAAIGEPDVAVCLRPGTELVFDNAVEYDNFLGIMPKRYAVISNFIKNNKLPPEQLAAASKII
jgi:hypothetical protein